jgi:hypothetical protein
LLRLSQLPPKARFHNPADAGDFGATTPELIRMAEWLKHIKSNA